MRTAFSKTEFPRKRSLVTGIIPALAAAILLASLMACKSPVGSDVVATVDGHKILRSEVDKYYEAQIASATQEQPSGEQATSLRLSILHQLIEDEIVMQRAEKLGLLATDEEVDRKYTETRSPLSEEEFA
ncbi:MAG TPA: SurA N-terminal domain-containing protein, partial [Terracidiphilus sp.]|nr:SurA N-terminal domain-containing protein [Terracidiphilus sp.]